MRGSGPLVLAVFGATQFLLAPSAAQSLDVEGVRVAVAAPLPSKPFGFGYASLDVENASGELQSVELVIEDGGGFGNSPASFVRRCELVAGERRRFEFVLPVAESTTMSSVTVNVDGTSRSHWLPGNVNLAHTSLVVAKPTSHATVQPLPVAKVDYYEIGFDALPGDHRAYDGTDFLLIDAAGSLPPSAAMAAIARHVRRGGCVAFFGRDLESLRAELPEIAPWLTPRFFVSQLEPGQIYGCGFGAVVVQPDDSVAAIHQAVVDWADNKRSALEHIDLGVLRSAQLKCMQPPFPGRKEASLAPPPKIEDRRIPTTAVAVLLIVVAVWIGPVTAFRARKRPISYLWRVPIAATVGSLALAVYSLLIYRIDVTTTARSLELLDVAEGRLITIERRRQVSGALGGEDLVPDAATDLTFARGEISAGTGSVPELLRVEEDEAGRWRHSGYLPARRMVEHLLRSERPFGGRLEAVPKPGGMVLTNYLDVTLRDVVLRGEGDLYFASVSGEPIPPGRSLELKPANADTCGVAIEYGLDFQHDVGPFRSGRPAGASRRTVGLPEHSLIAKLDAPLHRDDLDVDSSVQSSHHALIVVLPAGGAR
jgi:hypothetical protein